MTNLCNFSKKILFEIEKQISEVEYRLVQCTKGLDSQNLNCIQEKLNNTMALLEILKSQKDTNIVIDELISNVHLIYLKFTIFCNKL
ncbi:MULTISPECIES: hypothetical protein [Bacillus]|uniref:Uncharacterized protein n=1 Tax=Bacillus thuringiensis YBT-1518 TaxID=529122 RepID=A0A9W3KJW9_BACTU|nr:hypothetical protein [Bacillus thuringiensis]EKS8367288.1 hypothetical protein [Bacillus cereus]AHA75576.1 hypothetical protein YBT1518_32732 [Bacillus thuringiensis YBT-1518]MBG9486878.1 hypothetical protein [Bacillus thuringiensis]MBG9492181.1 hypothetical protein [Bacillus thuringiensis]MED3390927.1 hypothetical protein [Bacillus thuringiensis]